MAKINKKSSNWSSVHKNKPKDTIEPCLYKAPYKKIELDSYPTCLKLVSGGFQASQRPSLQGLHLGLVDLQLNDLDFGGVDPDVDHLAVDLLSLRRLNVQSELLAVHLK